MAHVDTPISGHVLGVARDPCSGQPGRSAPTTMGHIQEERDHIPNDEHACVRDERWEQQPKPADLRDREHVIAAWCTHLCACVQLCVMSVLLTCCQPPTWTLTSRAHSPVPMSSRPAGAPYSCSSSRPSGRGLVRFCNSAQSTRTGLHRELVTSRRSQQTRDRTPSYPVLPA